MGYEKATMRTIAEAAGITVGNIYKYFVNKEALLSVIIDPVYSELEALLIHHDDGLYSDSSADIDGMFSQQTMKLFELVKKKKTEFIILVSRCAGSKYENTKEKLILVLGESIYDHLKAFYQGTNTINKNYKLYAYALAQSFFEGFFSIIKNYRNYNDMEKFGYEFVKTFYYGFKTILKRGDSHEKGKQSGQRGKKRSGK
jgi:AcrR family transcriptional regulator